VSDGDRKVIAVEDSAVRAQSFYLHSV